MTIIIIIYSKYQLFEKIERNEKLVYFHNIIFLTNVIWCINDFILFFIYRFNINLQTGPSVKPRDDTALHISVRLNQGYIARNSYKFGNWEVEQGDGQLPIGKCQSWEILILITEMDYKVSAYCFVSCWIYESLFSIL